MKSEESILARCSSNTAGRASRLNNSRAQQAMFWMAQLFLMADRGSDLNHIVRCTPMSPLYRQRAAHMSIVNAIRMRSGNEHLIKEMRHGL